MRPTREAFSPGWYRFPDLSIIPLFPASTVRRPVELTFNHLFGNHEKVYHHPAPLPFHRSGVGPIRSVSPTRRILFGSDPRGFMAASRPPRKTLRPHRQVFLPG